MATSLFANPIMVEDYVETSKQITKALKCVAFTNMQVGDMMLRKHERLEKRIIAISEEIELLQTDVIENVGTQRERRQQLADIEDDIERAEVLGNALMVEELLDELKVLQDEGKREDALCRSLKKALRSRRRVRKEFIAEKRDVEDEMRTFNRKQNLIQSLLSTFARDSMGGASRAGGKSVSSSSDAGSTMTDFDESEFSVTPDESAWHHAHVHSTDAVVMRKRQHQRSVYSPEPMRPRRWSADETTPPKVRKPRVRVRRSLSVNFAPSRPHSLGSVEEEDDEDGDDDKDSGGDGAGDGADTTPRCAPTAAASAFTDAGPRRHELFNASSTATADAGDDAARAAAAAVRAAEPVELEEIHDEQDNYYSYASESSDESSGDSDDEHESVSASATSPVAAATATAATSVMPVHEAVVIGAGVHRVLANEMHTLKLSDEVAAAVASVKTQGLDVSSGETASSTAAVAAAAEMTTHSAPAKLSSDRVEVALTADAAKPPVIATLAA